MLKSESIRYVLRDDPIGPFEKDIFRFPFSPEFNFLSLQKTVVKTRKLVEYSCRYILCMLLVLYNCLIIILASVTELRTGKIAFKQ